jgi:hypothetical protein
MHLVELVRIRFVAAATLALTLTAAACVPETAIQIAPGATRDSLVFLISDLQSGKQGAGFIYGLSILQCNTDRAAWTIAADGSRTMPDHVVYGRPVPGFATRAGPDSLHSGCYRAVVSSSNPLVFDVSPTGGITVRASKP